VCVILYKYNVVLVSHTSDVHTLIKSVQFVQFILSLLSSIDLGLVSPYNSRVLFQLNRLLYVQSITKNLLSVSQFSQRTIMSFSSFILTNVLSKLRRRIKFSFTMWLVLMACIIFTMFSCCFLLTFLLLFPLNFIICLATSISLAL